jgi:ureidoacrylate peracid hydrolase
MAWTDGGIGKEASEICTFSRRNLLGLIGATAAATLVEGAAGEFASASAQLGATTQPMNARVVKIDAKPEPILIEVARTAVIVVDMQNDFGAKGGMFDLAGIDITGIRKAIAPTAKVLTSARQAGIKIVYLKMAFRPDLSDFGAPDSPNRLKHQPFSVGKINHSPDGKESRILIRDTWDTDILDELKSKADDVVIYKHRYSGFYQTDLDATLRKLGIKYLIVTGCTTSVCVEATVRDAMYRDYSCVLLEDCMIQPTLGHSVPGSSDNASLVVTEASFGWVSNSKEFIKTIQS